MTTVNDVGVRFLSKITIVYTCCYALIFVYIVFLAACLPVCSNGGTCVSPGVCTCPATYSGATCTTRM